DVLVVGFNSTRGAIDEALERLTNQGMKVNHAQVRLIHPFPVEEMQALMAKAKKVVVVENNFTGQLANIMKMNVGGHNKITTINKYDGTPFLPGEIETKVKELLK
ncbi:MAG TPA: 2-oxoacid:acceptor oxidoreductase subunit alpha, partial [Metalysinibacillus sp.]